MLRNIIKAFVKNSSQKLRFILVGGINTTIDFVIFLTLSFFGLPVVAANIISTSVAFCFSFIANRKFTFQSTGTNLKRQIVLFLIVTLFGLWVLQPIIITFVQFGLKDSSLPVWLILITGKILATVVTLIWNYLLYSRFVFKKD
ncbi:MAG: GtrA family protein [Candidatus Saccharibacteria bacterium]